MAMAEVVEISSESTKSFEDAIADGIAEAGTSVHGIHAAELLRR